MAARPTQTFLVGGALGAVAGVCSGLALNSTVVETLSAGMMLGVLGGMIGSALALLNGYPAQARMFQTCFAIVFATVFLTLLAFGFWQSIAAKYSWSGLVLFAGMLSGLVFFTMGAVWGVIVTARQR
jgi:hypothetical protein